MKDKHVIEHLSSFIDGECEASDYVARHLQSCQDCARRHMELVKLSNHLGALRGPDVDAAFAARVVARLEGQEKPMRWFAPLYVRPLLSLTLAAFAFTVGFGSWYQFSRQAPPDTARGRLESSEWLDDDVVVLAFRELLDSGRWENPFEQIESGEDAGGPVLVDELLDSLADLSIDAHEEGAWYLSDDWLSVIDALALEDIRLLDELATANWNEG